jgi:predicted DNA-binding transcriptional regulator AlpA
VAKWIDPDDLIDSSDMADLLGLSSARAVYVYQSRYAEMPKPVVDRGRNRARLWLKSDVILWMESRKGRQ